MIPFGTTLRSIATLQDEILTTTQAKVFARIYNDFEDSVVESLITTARVQVEEYLSRALVEQTFLWTVQLLEHPDHPYNNAAAGVAMMFGGNWGLEERHYTYLEIPRSPCVSIASVEVLDHYGNVITLPSGTWWVDTAPDPAVLKIDWHLVTANADPVPFFPLKHIQVQFDAGYTGAEVVPNPVIQAIYLLINFMYERRGDETNLDSWPKAVKALLDNYRVYFAGGTLN